MPAVTVAPVSVVIPTFGRDEVLTDTISQLLAQEPQAAEIIVVDQTVAHDLESERQLRAWESEGAIRWLRPPTASQPMAMNQGLLAALSPIVLFIDDDIRIEQGFVGGHGAYVADSEVAAVIGQILQPGERPLEGFVHAAESGPFADFEFPFRSATAAWIRNGMSGNMSVKRGIAIALGGFDENFLAPVSYRFDSDFCARLVAAGHRIRFDPKPRIHHLRATRGGTRSLGSHLTSASPMHGIGDYYYALRRGLGVETLGYVLRRPFREVATRFHLRHPWWIPVKFFGELRALWAALRLNMRGPRTL
jgi:glycosyltransferase involved in cell wall biosynthesis